MVITISGSWAGHWQSAKEEAVLLGYNHTGWLA